MRRAMSYETSISGSMDELSAVITTSAMALGARRCLRARRNTGEIPPQVMGYPIVIHRKVWDIPP
jgi:hypothetical protein